MAYEGAMSRRVRRAKLVEARTEELEKSLLARDYLLRPEERAQRQKQAVKVPEIIYLRRSTAAHPADGGQPASSLRDRK